MSAHLSDGVPVVLLHGGGWQLPAAPQQVPVQLHRCLDELCSR